MKKKYRNELKYHINISQMNVLKEKLNCIMELDEHGQEGSYTIKSLYFDDCRDTCLRDTEGGEALRYKYRIRYYDCDSSFIRLEKKEKRNSLCHKASCVLSSEEYDSLTSRNVNELVYSSEKKLLKRFCADILSYNFTPKVIIEYERVAYVDVITNVRITFDRYISASNEVDNFLAGDYFRVPIMDKDMMVLEVKFDDVLPSYIKTVIESISLIQTSNSKYALGRKAISAFF